MNEKQLQSKCVIEFKNQLGRHGIGYMVEVNQNQTNVIQAMQRRALGQVKGFPDTFIVLMDGIIAFIEFKTEKGVIKPEQKRMHSELKRLGHHCYIVRNYEDFIEILMNYGYSIK